MPKPPKMNNKHAEQGLTTWDALNDQQKAALFLNSNRLHDQAQFIADYGSFEEPIITSPSANAPSDLESMAFCSIASARHLNLKALLADQFAKVAQPFHTQTE